MNKSEKTKITKQKILEAAMKEFATYGYHGATINGICGHNGIAKGLIYHNFEGKDDLYLCCAHYAVSEFIHYVGQWEANADLLQYMRLRNEFLISHPYMGAIIFEMMLNTPQKLMEPLTTIKSDFDRFNIDLYSRAIHTIKLREGITDQDALRYYNLLQNMLNSYFSQQILSGEPFPMAAASHEKDLETILNYILYGIAEKA